MHRVSGHSCMQSASDRGGYPAGPVRAWIYWSIPAIFFLYEFMLRVSPSVVETRLQDAFSAEAADIGLSMSMYYAAYAPMHLVGGVLLDRVGSRGPLMLAALICGLGAALFAMAAGLGMLGAGRFLAGIGSAFAYVGAIYVASVWFPSRRLSLLAGTTAALGMAGAVAGQSILGWLDHVVTWRQTAWCFAAVAVIIALVLVAVVPKRPQWFMKQRAESLCAQGIEADSMWHGLRCVLSSRSMWLLALVAGLLYLPLGTFGALWGDRYLSECLKLSDSMAATAAAMLFLGVGVAAPLMGLFADRTGKMRETLILGSVLALGSMIGLLALSPAGSGLAPVMLATLGFGIAGITVAFPMAIHASPHHARGVAICFVNFFQMLMVGISQWGTGVLLDAGASAPGVYEAWDFRMAFSPLVGGLVLTVILAGFLPRPKPSA